MMCLTFYFSDKCRFLLKPQDIVLFACFFNCNCTSDGSTYHRVVAHAYKSHHFNVSGNGGRACKLCVGVHTSHSIGHAVAGGTCCHVIGMKRSARAAARCNGEVFNTVFIAPFLVGACDGVLEAGGVGGVAGDGDVDALMVHDGNALADIVAAVAADVCTLALGVADLADDLQLAGIVIELGLDIGEAVDTGDDLSGVLAETVEDDAQRLLAGLVGVLDDTDGALCGGEGLVAGEEGEALGVVVEEHCGQIAVADTDLAVICDGAVKAEALEADTDHLCGLCGGLYAGLDGDGRADTVCPADVLKADGLDVLGDLVGIEALCLADLSALFDRADAVLCEDTVYLVDSSLVAFK